MNNNTHIVTELAQQNVLGYTQADTPELQLERMRQQAALGKIQQAHHLLRSSAEAPDVPNDGRLKSFHFSLGNSSTGPVGFCMQVQAHTLHEALHEARERILEIHANIMSANNRCEADRWLDDQGKSLAEGEYTQVYFNADAIGPQDIDEWEYVNDQE